MCAVAGGSSGGQCPTLADYVMVHGPVDTEGFVPRLNPVHVALSSDKSCAPDPCSTCRLTERVHRRSILLGSAAAARAALPGVSRTL